MASLIGGEMMSKRRVMDNKIQVLTEVKTLLSVVLSKRG